MKKVTLGIALFLCTFAYSQVVKDTIFFNNGSLIIGKLKNVKLGIVTFDPDDANDVTVELRKLKTIAGGRSRIFRVETVNHHLYFGTILANSSANTMRIETGLDTIALNLQEISIMYPFGKSILRKLSGSLSFGYSYTRSSDVGRLNTSGNIKYTSRKTELNLTFSGIYTVYDSLFSRDNEEVNLKYNYYFKRNWFATAFLSYQRNLELSLLRRYQEGVGIGNKFITSRQVYAWARGGFVINQEKSTANTTSGTLAELFGQFEMNFFRFAKPKLNFVLAQTFYYGLSQAGRFRNDGSANINWEIFKNFNLNFGPYNNYDSRPPVEGSHQFDYGVVFGIKYTF